MKEPVGADGIVVDSFSGQVFPILVKNNLAAQRDSQNVESWAASGISGYLRKKGQNSADARAACRHHVQMQHCIVPEVSTCRSLPVDCFVRAGAAVAGRTR